MAGKPNSRESIVDTASKLFFKQGYHGTGLNQIIKESCCPKGSLYYYFPEGKEELALECIHRTKLIVADKWNDVFEKVPDPVQAVRQFIENMADEALKSNFEGFIPFSFWMAVETSAISNSMREACQSVLADWQHIISSRLLKEGLKKQQADETAEVLLSMLEGSLILAQTNRDTSHILLISKYAGLLLNEVLGRTQT
ncbi:TetR/AcrR family transcriptional regulator [Paenibacillus dokdonensis]|uniref:TetR/AcrR family transcriptional regulator n=1 Tax=Paenibacillus dokdonensis TaxID=2567944 RepID=A0ABU6GRR0_9BACL|nr:TetR/AcrR family transcriptional regulator [Paenibacillus dokdonensis]MEC0242432.1 TetR/AcrR family transcriptional regulator [Paenibacillus dokdonensis]